MAIDLNKRRHQRGQTSLEYLLLLAASFLAAYIMVRVPVSQFTERMLTSITSGLKNLITNAEWTSQTIEDGDKESPTSKERLKPLHL